MSATTTPYFKPVSQQFDVFLSYNSRDRAIVERIAQRLKRAGLEPWLDRWSLTPGAEWQRELGAGLDASVTCAVFIGPHDLGAWELQEVAVAIDRGATQRGFRVFPVLLPGVEEPFDPNRLPHFLRARTWVDFRRGRDNGRALQDLINAVKGVPFGPELPAAPADGIVPYRGLRVFGEEDAQFFFGRDREIQRLLEKLKSSTFVAVLGPSGSGKSSLVRAGLVPELRAGALAEVEHWHVCVLRPGAAPLTALAAQLATLHPGKAMQTSLDELARDPRTLHLSVELALANRPPGERVLVVVDQLEELFTLCRDVSERRQLFSTLLYATSAPGGRTVVIVTMRADFYVRCAAYPEPAQLITAQQMLVGPMDADGLRQAIEEPARRVGLELEEGLSETILADVAAEPGALPLLEHALLELWERRRGEMLTLEGYRETGGVHGALAQRAEEIFNQLSTDQQQIARRTLLCLTQPGEGTEDTRRRATRSELSPTGDNNSFDAVLDRLVAARLLTTGRDETGLEVVDVSHEALIRGWPRLRAWIDADRAGLLVHRRLSDAAREWVTLDREPGALYRGARLAAAREWATEHADDLSPLERDFLTASQTTEQRELETAERRTRRLRALARGLAALTLLVTAVSVWALRQRAIAQREESKAKSAALATSSVEPLRTRPDVSLALAFEAYRMRPRWTTRSAVVRALLAARQSGLQGVLTTNDSTSAVALSPDGTTLASAGWDGTVRLWNPATRTQLGRLTGHNERVTAVAFSPDGKTLASAGWDGTARLWNLATRKQLSGLTGDTGRVYAVAFSGDGKRLASGGDDGTIRLWNAATHTPLGTLRGHTGAVTAVASSRDGTTLASASNDGTVRIWNTATRERLGTLGGGSGPFNAVAFSPDGKLLAYAGDGGTVRLWNAATHKQLGTLGGGSGRIFAVAFSRDGKMLASAGDDDTIRLWNAATHKRLARLTGHTGIVYGLAFTADGTTLASAGDDDTIRLWNAATRTGLSTLTGHTEGAVYGLAFRPNSTTLASAGYDDTVRLWNAATGTQFAHLSADSDWAKAVAFSPDGKTLVSAGADGTITLWNARTRTRLRRLGVPSDEAAAVAFSPDGKILASAGAGGTIRLWNPATRTHLAPLAARTGPVSDVAFSPDGKTLASAGADGAVTLWDVPTRTQLGRLTGHTKLVTAVAFSPYGKTVASASYDGTIRLWNEVLWRSLDELHATVCNVIVTGLSRSEWAHYAAGIRYRRSCP